MGKNFANAAEYWNQLPADRFVVLDNLRNLIQTVMPGVQETIAYGMPTYEFNGEIVAALASQPDFISLYVLNTTVVNQYQADLIDVECAKRCLRFRNPDNIPFEIIERMLEDVAEAGQEI